MIEYLAFKNGDRVKKKTVSEIVSEMFDKNTFAKELEKKRVNAAAESFLEIVLGSPRIDRTEKKTQWFTKELLKIEKNFSLLERQKKPIPDSQDATSKRHFVFWKKMVF